MNEWMNECIWGKLTLSKNYVEQKAWVCCWQAAGVEEQVQLKVLNI